MLRFSYTSCFILLLLCFSRISVFATNPNSNAGNRIRLHLGPAIGFYKINTNHAEDPRQQISALVGFNKEFRLSKDYRSFFLVGADYFFHGLNFKSYYFSPDTIKIYDKNFNYAYTLFIHELNIPFQFKYLFKPENNSLFSPYLAVAYHLRYLLSSQLEVTQEGNLIKADSPELKFKTPLLTDQLNAAVSVSAGWQKNKRTNSKGSFYTELNFRYGFSPYYFETDYSASSLFINSLHLTLQLGLKF